MSMAACVGKCDYKILGGLSKGCNLYFCQAHSASNDDFQQSNIDEYSSAPVDLENNPDQELSKPFENQVCANCKPSLRRAYCVGINILVGIPTLVALACVYVYGSA